MFKITGAAMLPGILLADLSGAELKAVQNKVQYGKTAFHLQKGRISVTDLRLQLLVIVPHFKITPPDGANDVGGAVIHPPLGGPPGL